MTEHPYTELSIILYDENNDHDVRFEVQLTADLASHMYATYDRRTIGDSKHSVSRR